MSNQSEFAPEPLLQAIGVQRHSVSIGLPACDRGGERRFPLTPEGVHRLVERGFIVRVETNAPEVLNYNDNRYMRQGAAIVSRREALGCDIVIHLAPLTDNEIRFMKRGALLLTLFHPELQDAGSILPLLQRQITAIALDLIEDVRGNTPYADILAEINGRAAMTIGAGILADPERGKGILIGGVAGVVPCEAMVVGSGIAACSAARCASGLGATVRMFDDDVYSLRRSLRDLGPWVVASSLHPHVVEGALRSADIIVAAPASGGGYGFDSEAVGQMKRGAVVIDLSTPAGSSFKSLPVVDISDRAAIISARKNQQRICLVNPGNAVARTAAMALSDTLLTTFSRIFSCNNVIEALTRIDGLRRAAFTFRGRVVNPHIAACAGVRQVDINIFLRLS